MKCLTRWITGWIVAVVLASAPLALAFPVHVAQAPDTDYSLLINVIKSARDSLLINIYELVSPEIAEAIIDRVQAGLHVELLQEGQLANGPLPAAAVGLQSDIVDAMKKACTGARLYEMSSSGGTVKRRFRFNHAKYIVVDSNRLVIGSENYTPTGHPLPGTKGNRGWEVLLDHDPIAKEYARVFRKDADTSYGDVIDHVGEPDPVLCRGIHNSGRISLEAPIFAPFDRPYDGVNHRTPSPARKETAEGFSGGSGVPELSASRAEMILSPDNSVPEILSLLDHASTSIDIQQMTLNPLWGNTGKQSPMVDSIIAAARRKVKVRVLVNDESVFNSDIKKHKNRITVELLNKIAKEEKLPLVAKVANLKKMGVTYIHNKGVLVDGKLTLISSINWNQNSFENNREAAVLITSPEVFKHYKALFDRDWRVSK